LFVLACALGGAFGFLRTAPGERGLALQDGPTKPATSAPHVAKRDARVLFVGNSYCYVNDLPELVSAIASANPRGPQIAVESVTPGGATLKQHFESTGALEKIRAGGWTHVVLQAQSLEPLTNSDEFSLYAGKLAEEIKKSGAQVVFYQTWARKEGAKDYVQSWSGGTPKKMQEALDLAYAKAAKACGGICVRAGDAWAAALAEKDPLKLFAEDGSHPSLDGTYLTACVFYEALSGESCVDIEPQREGLNKKDAVRLQKIAHELAPIVPATR
jgi:hypothetical protein